MKVVVLRETSPGEARVALVPESVRKLIALKANVSVESGAGSGSLILRTMTIARLARRVSSDREALLSSADLLVVVNRPTEHDLHGLPHNAVVLGFCDPSTSPLR